MNGWVAVNIDGTLAHYDGWNNGYIGPPIQSMVKRIRYWLWKGIEVRILTARAADPGACTRIEEWCEKNLGLKLPVTDRKDFGMYFLYDDRVIQVEHNTGRILGEEPEWLKLPDNGQIL